MSAIGEIVGRAPAGPAASPRDGAESPGVGQSAPEAPAAATRRRWIGPALAALLLLAGGAVFLYLTRATAGERVSNLGFISNNSYIDGLYNNVNAKKTSVVFGYVFKNLEDEVTVYPSENYYYFNLTLRGKTLSGGIHLDVLNIDSGVVGFGFVERFEDRSRAAGRYRPGWSHDFGAEDGVSVSKVNDFRYKVSYQGRTVIFNLYNGDTLPPRKARLAPDEVYVGPSFDESGLRFFLIFNRSIGKLYWVLNEDGFVPESFSRLSDHVVTGDRTEFAFYLDSANDRKILIGAQGLNVAQNNWYDGPFDQLPDNYIKTGRLQIRSYLETHLGYRPGTLDRYGNYIGREKEARASVGSYTNYFVPEDLSFVDSSLAAGLTGARLYGALTLQRFDLKGAVAKGYLRRR